MDSRVWAQEQFSCAGVGDLRLRRRLVAVAARIRENPCGTLPRSICDRAELKAAYRLFSNPKVTHLGVLEPHVAASRTRCHEAGEYLMIEDTTALSFTQRGPVDGMGPLTQETSQGLLAHTALAVEVVRWNKAHEPETTLVGIVGQQCWARTSPQSSRKERKRVKRVAKRNSGEVGESGRWGQATQQMGQPPEHASWTLVADRECDIFQVLHNCACQGQNWVIRAAQARRTTSASGDVFKTVSQAPVLGRFSLKLRARPGTTARQACVEIRAVRSEVVAPRDLPGSFAPQPTAIVEVREIAPPAETRPLHWVLLTSWPCHVFAQARRVVGAYASRWLIEEYHKALKSGTHIEDSQLSSADGIEPLLALHAVIAVDLLQLKLLANTHPNKVIDKELLSAEALQILEAQFGCPESGWNYAAAIQAIARMGGYLGRKHDGPPGWLSIWRGWLKLTMLLEGYLLALAHRKCG